MGKSPARIHQLTVVASVLACYYTSLGCGLVFDDVAAIQDNRDLRPHTPLTNIFLDDFWGTPIHKEQSHKSYRPLCVLTFRLNYAVHGLQPFGYHLVNVSLHCLVCLLFYRMCLLFMRHLPSFMAAMLFAVHPVHTEAVAGVVGRAELLSAAFFLSALMVFVGGSRKFFIPSFSSCGADADWKRCASAVAMTTLGTLCKEQALTVLGVCCVFELASSRQRLLATLQAARHALQGRGIASPWIPQVLRRIGLLLASGFLLLCLRLWIMGSKLPAFSRFDNPASVASTPTRQLTYNYVLSVNAWLLLFPCDLCCDWTMGTLPLVTSLWDPRNVSTLLLYAALFLILYNAVWVGLDAHHTPVVMGVSLLVLPFLPASNFFFPVGFVVAERVLYLPSMGLCVLVAYGWHRLWLHRPYRVAVTVAIVLLIVVHAVKTVRRNRDWETEYSLYSSALKVNQRNAKLFNKMGQALENVGRSEVALQHYRQAIRLQPDDIRGYLNSGKLLASVNLLDEAEEVFLQAKSLLPQAQQPSDITDLRVPPSHLQVFLSLASLIAQNQSRLEEADALYKEVISLRSDFTDAYLNRGDVLLRMNRTKEAEAMYERALQMEDRNPDLYHNLGVVLMDQGRGEEALALFNKALDLDPDHEHALMNSAFLIQESGMASQRQVAADRLQKMVHQGKQNERVYFNLGRLALENKDAGSAEQWFKKAIEIKPDLRGALFNLALLLSDQQRPADAMFFLRELLKYYPDHIKGLLLLGDININYFRDLEEAEKNYNKILTLDPKNVQGLHNLCVVFFERGELHRAESCFQEAVTLDPNATYIQRHLQATQSLLRDTSEPRNGLRHLRAGDASVLQQMASSATLR